MCLQSAYSFGGHHVGVFSGIIALNDHRKIVWVMLAIPGQRNDVIHVITNGVESRAIVRTGQAF